MSNHKRTWKNSKKNKGSGTWSSQVLSALFVTVMAVSLLSGIPAGNMERVQAATTLKNPRKDSNGVVTWDCVYFGRYPQSDATGKTKDPIKWRVLSVDGDDAFLVADKNLDVQKYNDSWISVTWETCTMRSWLNGYGSDSNVCEKDYSTGNFLDRAFTASEQKEIKTTDVVNADNPAYGTAGGNSTQDKIFLLSYDEVTNLDYGFSSDYITYDNARERINTAYVANGGTIGSSYMVSEGSTDWWWLRSPGYGSHDATDVDNFGAVLLIGIDVCYNDRAVCPALHLNLSSSNLWSYAGTVSSDGNTTGGDNPSPVVGEDEPVSDGCLSLFDSMVTVTSGKETSISGTVRNDDFDALLNLYDNLECSSSDESVVTAKRSSLDRIHPTMPVENLSFNLTLKGYAAGSADVTVSCSDGHKVVYHVSVVPEEVAPEVTYLTGTIQNIDDVGLKVTIDNKTYDVTKNFDMTKAANILGTHSCKTVVAMLENGYVAQMDDITEVMEPRVESITPATYNVLYQNGSLDKKELTLNIGIACSLKAPYPSDVEGLRDINMHFSNLKLEAVGDGLNFGTTGIINRTEIKLKEENIDINLSPGESRSFSYTVKVKDGYVPDAVSTACDISAEVATDYGMAANICSICFGNLDKQQELSEQKKNSSASGKGKLDVVKELDKMSIVLNKYPLNTYFNDKEIEKMNACITTWLASSIAAASIVQDEDSGIMQIIKEKNGLTSNAIMNSVFKKMGINYDSMMATKTLTATTKIQAKDKSGKWTDVNFTVVFSNYAFSGKPSYAAFGKINYNFQDGEGGNHSALGGTGGMVTFTDMDGYIASVQSLTESNLKSFYNQFWGKDADKVVEMLTSETVNKILKDNFGSFSENVFKLMEAPTRGWKWFINSCPNDVYIYDSEGKLCGSIVDNQVAEGSGELLMYTVGEKKYFCLPEDDYMVKYVGTDTGSMDLEIQECGDSGITRTVVYKDIPLMPDKAYTSVIPEYGNASLAISNPVSDTGDMVQPYSDTLEVSVHPFVFVDSISLNYKVIDMFSGEKKQLLANITPQNASNKLCEWKSEDDGVATVDENGVITAVAEEGSTVITAMTLDGNRIAQCKVNVSKKQEENTSEESKTEENTTGQTVTEENIAGGEEPTEKQETTTETSATGNTGTETGSEQKNTSIAVEKIELTGISKKIAAGKKIALIPVFTPSNCSNKALKWKSSNPKYATVSGKGIVSTKKKGEGKSVTITAMAQDGSNVKAEYKIKLVKDAVKSVKLTSKSKSVKAGSKLSVKAIVKTTGKTANKTLLWTSSNKSYATVTKKGVVNTKKAGKGKMVKITAKATDGTGKKATIKIRIK